MPARAASGPLQYSGASVRRCALARPPPKFNVFCSGRCGGRCKRLEVRRARAPVPPFRRAAMRRAPAFLPLFWPVPPPWRALGLQ